MRIQHETILENNEEQEENTPLWGDCGRGGSGVGEHALIGGVGV